MAHDVLSAAKPKADTAKPARPELPRGDVIDERRILSAYKQMLVALFVSTLIVTGVLIALLLPFSFLFKGDRNPPLIFVVILAGALGAFFSALIRLYNFDDLPKALVARELEGLPKGHLRIYSLVPAVIGAISATVLYLVFAADMLQGGLFPKFGCELGENKCDLFRTLLNQWHPAQASDYAKTLVWSFIAGFAERLVPDTLQGLTRVAQPTSTITPRHPPIDDARYYWDSRLRLALRPHCDHKEGRGRSPD